MSVTPADILARAREQLLEGDGVAASATLDALDAPARLFATLVLSREASACTVSPEAQEPLFRALDAHAPTDPKANALGDGLDSSLFVAWHHASGAFPIERVVTVLRHARLGGAGLALDAVRRALANGQVDDARALAELIPASKKAWRTEALARIAVAGPEKARSKALVSLVRASAKKKVSEGGEETDALGAVLEAIAAAGLPVSELAVELVRSALLQLTDLPTTRQRTDWGVLRAIGACASRVEDPAWRALGEELERHGLQHPVSRREARRIWAAARGEPTPPPFVLTVEDEKKASIGARAAARLIAGDAPGASVIVASNHSESYIAGREAAELLLETGHAAEAVAWAARLEGAFDVVSKGVSDAKHLDGLYDALDALRPYFRGLAVTAFAAAAARLSAMDAWRARLLPRVEALEDQRQRRVALSILAATAPPAEALGFVALALAPR